MFYDSAVCSGTEALPDKAMYVTYQDLIQIGILVVALANTNDVGQFR